jgi:uncharacterized membrane-anchored protein YitT (DUF2179 family)
MSNILWRILIAIVIAGHGVGHIFFLVPTLGLAEWGLAGRSWLLSDHVPGAGVKVVGGALWLLAIAGFVAASIGVLSQQEWWRGVAVASAAVSLLGLVLFAQPLQPIYSAGLMDLATLVALLLIRWPTVELVGS